MGEWVQLPTHALGRIRGLRLRSGEAPSGVARIKRLRLTCYDLRGNDPAPVALESVRVELADRSAEQRIVLPRAIGECDALRLTVEELFGPATRHGTIAELGLIAAPARK